MTLFKNRLQFDYVDNVKGNKLNISSAFNSVQNKLNEMRGRCTLGLIPYTVTVIAFCGNGMMS